MNLQKLNIRLTYSLLFACSFPKANLENFCNIMYKYNEGDLTLINQVKTAT